MKKAILLSAALVVMPAAFAQSGGIKGTDTKGMEKKAATASAHKATGVITKKEKDSVTIRHEPVPSMNWPTMTMSFKVKDKAVMDRMKQGQKVDFEFVQQGRDYVVTGVK